MENYVIKAKVADPEAEKFVFIAEKTMYGGKKIAEGDIVYVFASDHEGGQGLCARGVVTSSRLLPKPGNVKRHTPRVDVTVKRTALAKKPLGRIELKVFDNWSDGVAETELNFKLYRQATNKVAGITEKTARFLDSLFEPAPEKP